MTTFDIEKGFWYYKPEINFPPKGIDSVGDYQQTEKLNLYLTDKKQVKIWCETLPKLEEVIFLWVSSNVTQDLFDSICQMKNLIGLNIEKNTVTNIDKINKLHKIKYLRLANFTKIESINSIGKLSELEVLSIENIKQIADFKILGNLKLLKGLSIDGSMYEKQKIDNINFILNLTELKYLMLINTTMNNQNFDSILNLKKLETFNSSLNYPNSEFEKLNVLLKLKNSNVPIINKNGR